MARIVLIRGRGMLNVCAQSATKGQHVISVSLPAADDFVMAIVLNVVTSK